MYFISRIVSAAISMANFSKTKATKFEQAAAIGTVDSSDSMPMRTTASSSESPSASTASSVSASEDEKGLGKEAERTVATNISTLKKKNSVINQLETSMTNSGTAGLKSDFATESAQAAAVGFANASDCLSEPSIATLGDKSEMSKTASKSDSEDDDGSGHQDGDISPTIFSNEPETNNKRRMKAIGDAEHGNQVKVTDKKRRRKEAIGGVARSHPKPSS